MWRDHLLAGSLLNRAPGYSDGFFAFLHPKDNQRCVRAVDAYRDCLGNTFTFVAWTIEGLVDALRAEAGGHWVDLFASRYLAFETIDSLLREASLGDYMMRADYDMENPFPVHVHEAGHAVVALALGIDVESVSVAVDLRSPHPHGRTTLGAAFSTVFTGGPVTRADAMRAAMFCLGGTLNEELVPLYDMLRLDAPMAPDRSKGKGPGDDIYEAYRFADMLGGAAIARHTLASLMSRALGILRGNRAPAVAIAAELCRVRTLPGAELRELWLANGGCLEPSWEIEILPNSSSHPTGQPVAVRAPPKRPAE